MSRWQACPSALGPLLSLSISFNHTRWPCPDSPALCPYCHRDNRQPTTSLPSVKDGACSCWFGASSCITQGGRGKAWRGRSWEGQEQSAETLGDKIQDVKSLFSSQER